MAMIFCDVCGVPSCGTFHGREGYKYGKRMQARKRIEDAFKAGKSIPKELLTPSKSTGQPTISPKKANEYIRKHGLDI